MTKFDPSEHARSWLGFMDEFAAKCLAAKEVGVLDADDEKWLEIGQKKARDAFDQLAKFYIAPLQSPARAAGGYMMLLDLMVGAFAIGSRGNISASARKLVTREAKAPLSIGGAKGGRKGAATKKAKADARWRKQAEQIVKEIWVEGGRKRSKLALVSEIKGRWAGDANTLPSDKTIERMIDEVLRRKISLDT
jgi:hypothetical protein